MGIEQTIAVVTRQTRLAGLRARHGSADQAKFVLARAHTHEGARRGVDPAKLPSRTRKNPASRSSNRKRGTVRASDEETVDSPYDVASDALFSAYISEEESQEESIQYVRRQLDFGLAVKVIDRSFLPTYDFWNTAVVVVVGQDGLVANTAKYVGKLPIVGVNPDPRQNDGILVRFAPRQTRAIVKRVLERRAQSRQVTLAEVALNDGQRMLAFNDLFVGPASHISARYVLEVDGARETQSSSGVLISTGAGSTGWMSSVFNMSAAITHKLGGSACEKLRFGPEERRLFWAVREPFISQHSQANLVAGFLNEGNELILESIMPEAGVIFSDGIEADFLEFNSGAIARIGVANQTANLIIG